MKISELILLCQQVLKEEGDIEVVSCESHEYWGTIHNKVEDWNTRVGDAQPKGVKSGESEKCLILGN